jgi:hypothetical protein
VRRRERSCAERRREEESTKKESGICQIDRGKKGGKEAELTSKKERREKETVARGNRKEYKRTAEDMTAEEKRGESIGEERGPCRMLCTSCSALAACSGVTIVLQ